MSRKITVYTTGSGTGKVIETDGVNWGQLKTELGKAGVSYNSMKAVVGKTKTNLEHNEAMLPDEDFTLFLFPEKTRSGALVYTDAQIRSMSFASIRAALKVLASEDEASFKAHFNVGKNYTTKSTDEVKDLYISYQAKNAKGSKGKAAKADVVESLKGSKTTKPDAVAAPAKGKTTSTTDKPERVKREAVEEVSKGGTSVSFKNDDERVNFIIDLIGEMTSPTSNQKDIAISAIAALKAGSEVKGSKSTTSFTPIDTKSLQAEAESIRRGLSGIQ